MRAIRRLYVGVLCMLPAAAIAGVPYCPPSLEAPLQQDVTSTVVRLPRGHLFQPLIADPKEQRFFLAYRNVERLGQKQRIGVMGVGETFPLLRRIDDCPSDGLQLDLVGGAVGRFLLDNGSNDLIDADYNIGLPLSWRHGNWSTRARLYHESSHLGENELFQAGTAQRLKRSYDAADLLGSYDKPSWRVYAGVEYLFYHYPKIKPWGLHFGGEYYSRRNLIRGTARWISGLDVRAYDEYNFDLDVSLKTGLSFGGRHPTQHHLQVMLEWYDGHANEGVMFEEPVKHYGVGIYFGF
jgi:hypothetical protein